MATKKRKPPSKAAQESNCLSETPFWTDQRLTDLRHNQYAWPAPEVTTRDAWEVRTAWVRQRALLSAGLWPMEARAPLNARVWDEIEHDGCRIAKVRFESRPGYFVTGNLYRPLRALAKAPAVLCPHGHAPNGRLHHEDWFSIPARCVMLARLGFVAFSYDMIGYNDSRQTMHRWPLETLREAHLHGLSPYGLQTWNSVRAIDFLCELPDVDGERIGCTGASGGGSQTWHVGVVDERVKVLAPVCMLSSHYQGGCVCEEGPLIRLAGLTTLDMVGALAPRPVFLVSVTGDWTSLNPDFEVPKVRAIYGLFSAGERVGAFHFDAGHNYGREAREHVYAWFLRWLMDDASVGDRVPEPQLADPPVDKMRITPADKPEPTVQTTRRTLRRLAREETAPFREPPATRGALRRFCRRLRKPYAETLGVDAEVEDVAARVAGVAHDEKAGYTLRKRVLSRRGVGDVIPALWVVPDGWWRRNPVNLVCCDGGKAELFNGDKPGALLKAMIRARQRVLAVDLIGLGETEERAASVRRPVEDPTFYAFNPSLLSMRVQDVLTSLSALRQYEGARTVRLWGTGEGARAALLALPLARGLRAGFLDLKDVDRRPGAWRGDLHHPLILKVGELKTAVALHAPAELALLNPDPDLAAWAEAVYTAAEKPARLRLARGAEPKLAKWVAGG